MTEPRPITAKRFHDALVEANVIRDGENIRRVVIDASAREAVVMYVERYGDERLLDVVPTLDGVEVRTGSPDAHALHDLRQSFGAVELLVDRDRETALKPAELVEAVRHVIDSYHTRPDWAAS